MGWIIRSFYFNNIDQDLAYQVIEGRLAMDLIKPVNIQLMYVARAAGESVFRLALLTIPTAVVLFLVYPLRLPASVGHAAAFLVSVLLSFLIVAAINFAVGTFALRLQSILGLMRAKFFLLELFSGLLLPMTFFPHVVQKILAVMPFRIHQLCAHVDLPGQTERCWRGARHRHPDFVDRGSAGNRRRPVALVNAKSDYPGRVAAEQKAQVKRQRAKAKVPK